MKVPSVFIKYLNYACKITWIEFLITLCLVKNSIQISKRLDSFEKHINNSSSCETLALVVLACEQALKLNWEPASMTNEFEYLRLKSWREILIGQML
jgi:hypothetical protein